MSRPSTPKSRSRTLPPQPEAAAARGPALAGRLAFLRPCVPALALLLALLPILNMVRIIATAGADNPSVDYLYYMEMIDRILDGTYAWGDYFRDTFLGGVHSMALPFALRLAVIKFTAWDIRAELYLVVALSVARLVVLHRLFASFAPPLVRWLMLPLLSALVFSTSQVDTFTYGDAGLQLSLIHLGFTLGLWALVRAQGKAGGVGWMAAAGLLSTLSGGGGLAAWPVFLVGMLLLGYRRPVHFGVWAAGAALGVLPYLFYLFLFPKNAGRRRPGFIQPAWFVNALGWPFANDIGADRDTNVMAFGAGLAAVLLLAAGLALIAASARRRGFREAVPALLIVLMGLVSIAQIGLFRSSIGPWYTTAFMTVWIGLLGLVVAVWTIWRERSADPTVAGTSLHRLTPLWCAGVPLIIASLYAGSNLTYEDKTMLLYYRSPASASALRNYRIAPTHCAEHLLVNIPRYEAIRQLAAPLEKHRLSLFAPRQIWELQGDFLLDTVTVEETPAALPVRWCAGPGGPVLPWSDFRHLDLQLHGANRVAWRITVPAGAREATLRTAVATAPYEPATGAAWKLSLTAPTSEEEVLSSGELTGAIGDWKPLDLPLAKYAGQEVTLHFAATGDPGSAPVLFRYPRLELYLPERPPLPLPDEIRPGNTDRSPRFPKDTPGDLVLDLTRADLWQLDAPESAGPAGLTLGPGQSAQHRPRLDIDLRAFTHLKLAVRAGAELDPPALRVFFGLQRPDGAPAFPYTTLILLPATEPGGYTYDLRLLEAEPGTRLNTVRFFSVSESGPLQVTGCRLRRAP